MMAISEIERRSVMACLSAMEANGAELRGLSVWCARIGPDRRREFDDFLARVRWYRHDMESLLTQDVQSGKASL